MGPARRHLPIDGSLGMRNLLWDVVDGIMLNCAAALYVYNKKVLQLILEEVAKMILKNYGASTPHSLCSNGDEELWRCTIYNNNKKNAYQSTDQE